MKFTFKSLIYLLLITTCSLLLSGCSKKFYIGYFYPDTNIDDRFIESDPLYSLDECQRWKNSQISIFEKVGYYDEGNRTWDYECGVDCREGDDYNQGTKYTCKGSAR